MKKISLFLGALGGAMAGYIASNKKLRDELMSAKDAEAAAISLGKHLQKDGKHLAKQVQHFVESDDVQHNLTKAKKFAKIKMDEASRELQKLMKQGATAAKKSVKKGAAKAKKAGKKMKARVRSIA